jgi:hypothetical protein
VIFSEKDLHTNFYSGMHWQNTLAYFFITKTFWYLVNTKADTDVHAMKLPLNWLGGVVQSSGRPRWHGSNRVRGPCRPKLPDRITCPSFPSEQMVRYPIRQTCSQAVRPNDRRYIQSVLMNRCPVFQGSQAAMRSISHQAFSIKQIPFFTLIFFVDVCAIRFKE